MKKLLCFRNTELLKAKRLVFQYSAEEQQGAIETTVKLSDKMKSFEDESKAMETLDAARGAVGGQIDTYIDGQKALLKKAREKAKEEDKKNFPSDEDFDKALQAAKKGALGKLEGAWNEANGKREKNAEAWAKTQSMLLAAHGKEAGTGGTFEQETSWGFVVNEGELRKNMKEIDWRDLPEIEYRYKGENKTDSWTSGTLQDGAIEALKVVYKEQGKDEAQKIIDKLVKASEGLGYNVGAKKFDEIMGGALRYAGDNEMYGDENELSRSQAGKIMGLAWAAQHVFGDSAEGQKAMTDYTAYVKNAMQDVNSDNRNSTVDGLMTPTEWAMKQGGDTRRGLKSFEQKGEAVSGGPKELVETVKDGLARTKLRGIMEAIGKTESDPKKQNMVFQDLLTKLGINDADALEKLTPEALNQLLKDKKLDGYGDAIDKLDGIKTSENTDMVNAFKNNLQGYFSGLEMAADGKQFKEGNIDYTDRFRAAYKEYVKGATSSDKMSDLNNKLSGILRKPEGPLNMITWASKMPSETAALLSEAKKGVKTPDEYFTEFKAKEDEKYKGVPKEYQAQERYVDSVLTKVPAGKTKEASYLRGILIAAVGRETDPEKMKAATDEALKELGTDSDKLGEIDYSKNFKQFVDDRKDFTENGDKMDDMSKGLAVGLIYSAELKFKDDPNKDKILAKYKEYLKDKMDKLGSDSDNSQAAEDLRGDLREYARKAKKGIRDQDLEDEIHTLQDKLYRASWKAMAWPDTFKKDFDKKEGEQHKQLMEENKAFLDQYGTSDKLDATNSKKSLDAIIGGIPKEKVTDANKKDVEAKKKELAGKLAKAKNESERLQILAEAADYSARVADEKADEKRYKVAVDNYVVTNNILNNTDTKKYPKYLKDVAKGLGLKEDDPAVKKALRAAEDAKEEDRAAVMAAQVLELYKAAPENDKGEKPSTPFTKEDFDYYSQYINEKKEAAKAKKKSSPQGVGGGGAPTPGGGGAPAPGKKETPPGKKETPEPGKEKPPEQTPFEQAKSALVGTLASFISKMKQFPDMGITSAEILTSKVSEEIGKIVTGVDVSKVPDQVISVDGGGATLTIAGGKITQINVAPWAANIYAKSKEEAEPPKEKEQETNEKQKQLVAKLSSYAAQHYQAWIESMHGASGVRGKFQQEISYYVQSQGLDLSILDKPYQVCMYGFVTPQQKPMNVVVSVSKGGVSARTLNA